MLSRGSTPTESHKGAHEGQKESHEARAETAGRCGALPADGD